MTVIDTPSLMSNIFTKPEDYRVHFDGARYVVFVNTLYHCNLATQERVDTFLNDRLQPVAIPARVYEDICRCPKDIILWKYAVTNTGTDDLIWEVCKKCRNPLRHNVMLEINRGLIEDFDLEAFLGL
jgi:hypothetical protein